MLTTKGIAASPGAVVGQIVFTADDAVEKAGHGAEKNPVILVRAETTPEDIHGMEVAIGILTSQGGATSHAAVVTRGMGKSCVAGAGEIAVDERAGEMRARGAGIQGGRLDHARRHQPAVCSRGKRKLLPPDPENLAKLKNVHELGGAVPKDRSASQCGHSRDARRRASLAPRASACAAPSTCSLLRIASRTCAP